MEQLPVLKCVSFNQHANIARQPFKKIHQSFNKDSAGIVLKCSNGSRLCVLVYSYGRADQVCQTFIPFCSFKGDKAERNWLLWEVLSCLL